MGTNEITKLDERGRLIIPASFREALALKEGSNVFLRLDSKNKILTLLPFSSGYEKLARIGIRMGDSPGTLSKILGLLSSEGIDLVWSESSAQERGRSAEWNAIVDVSGCRRKLPEIKKLLLKGRLARDASVEQI